MLLSDDMYPQRYCHAYDCVWTVFGLLIGIVQHLCTQHVTTSNCSAIANSYTLQFTAARTKFSQSAVSSPVVAW
jgi:hypothetical protein